ncbi:MAG: hypothetical protein GY795_11435 [Desulfobacterales bacterium]|nr:hypothetical protein [Desulfobacterales bacterium]
MTDIIALAFAFGVVIAAGVFIVHSDRQHAADRREDRTAFGDALGAALDLWSSERQHLLTKVAEAHALGRVGTLDVIEAARNERRMLLEAALTGRDLPEAFGQMLSASDRAALAEREVDSAADQRRAEVVADLQEGDEPAGFTHPETGQQIRPAGLGGEGV